MSDIAFKPYVAKNRRFDDLSFPFLIVNDVGKQWYDGGENQFMPERAICKSLIKTSDTVVDCGAHHGMMSVLFSHWTGPAGKVYSYEIVPDNIAVIRQNIELNKLDNVTVRPYGVGDENAEISISFQSSNAYADSNSDIKARIVRLDDDIPTDERVDFIKIDVEGSDLRAVRGASRVLSKRPTIDLELHPFLFADRGAVTEEIFSVLSYRNWRYIVLPEIFADTIEIDGQIDYKWLSAFDNPHIFCIPR
ncbi:FkbM family methyltransferase [Methylosinus sp. H3A]|uniref:FkbM family methyltransferase n=1 Tax=Methylosinus sp. H3A TaxID=2785786 RepID=UPI0018C2F6C6|nr:FkbM family methyltransferase [Methylosinus sp. H3A]MBG0811958.1 FkbM family methyltransferase [Methylosinus sp. H3A]